MAHAVPVAVMHPVHNARLVRLAVATPTRGSPRPAPGAVEGLNVTAPPPTPVPGILPPVASLPAPLPVVGAAAVVAPWALVALALLTALVCGSTLVLARRRL